LAFGQLRGDLQQRVHGLQRIRLSDAPAHTEAAEESSP
jgi:hypothetical protein